MTPKPMPRTFDFAEAEPRLYAWWEQNGWFKPEVAGPNAEPFVISMPPPNVTGALHVGHALFVALEDMMIRYERMRGKAALWVPGTDHAGIATQLQVERLLQEEGTSRQQLGREAFVARTWAWKEQYGGTITRQLRRLGASCDWDRERFTLDDGLSRAVQEVFIRLYEQGLIYRGPRLVNWSPGLQTAVSDLEVEREDEPGSLYYFKYPIEGGEHIPVATTRPETILGDTAVAVHPEDERYRHLIGRMALVPMLNRRIPVIADEYVSQEFGTGALKVTPGHDPNDYVLGQRHGLDILNVMNRDATMNENAGPYAGLDRFECRERLWADIEAAGLAIKVEQIVHPVPRSQRGGEIIEPLISTQWFLRAQPLAEQALAAVRDGRIKIVPERFEKVYYHWLENIEDWCISRQLWWGHRIPAWYGPNGEIHVGSEPPAGDGWKPEEDVLDTWFSSGLWPFSTLGWPEETPDFQRYYPTSVMETGYDILFFWVARMIMMGLWFTGRAPFHTVYLHGLVRDAKGRKISKTLGNTIDPLDLMERFGTDPLRFTLITSGTPGNDVNLDVARVEGNWRFVNKLWQMANFVTGSITDTLPDGLPDVSDRDLPARWICSRLTRLIQGVQYMFDHYLYGEPGRQIYEFLWGEYADWYIEISKHALYEGSSAARTTTLQILVHVLETSLRLLHPYMPFVTEEIWQYLPHKGETLMLASWPAADDALIDDQAEAEMAFLMDVVRGIRAVRNEYRVDPGRRISAIVAPGAFRTLVEQYAFIFARLCNVTHIEWLAPSDPAPSESASVIVGEAVVYLPLAGLVDILAERQRLEKERAVLEQQIARTESMLSNDQFVNRAPVEVVERERVKLADLKASLAQTVERLNLLTG